MSYFHTKQLTLTNICSLFTDSFGTTLRILAILIGLNGLVISSTAQTGFYTAPGANFFVHGDTVGMMLNVTNKGNFGSKPGGVVKFMGIEWFNDSTASFPDENSYTSNISLPTPSTGKGGIFLFSNSMVKAPAYGLTQIITGGGYSVKKHSGEGFPSVYLDNVHNLLLKSTNSSDLQIRNNLNFIEGKLILGDNGSLYVGDYGNNKPGSITGYNNNKYVVTGNTLTGGFLYRAKFDGNNGQVVFPVGATIDYYTPAAITNKGTAEDFKVRPFNAIFSEATTGTQGNQKFVQTTWNIGKETNSNVASNVEVVLQHPVELEGLLFSKERDSSYITQFNDVKKVWDTVPANLPKTLGSLTTGSSLVDNYTNIRNFTIALSDNGFFSKTYAPKNSIFGLTKNLDSIVLNPDETHNVHLTFIVQNQSDRTLNNITVSDNLVRTFTNSMSWKVLSLTHKSSPTITLNNAFTGIDADTTLTKSTSSLVAGESDTIKLVIKLNANKLSGIFYNTAIVTGKDPVTNDIYTESSSNGLNTIVKNRNKTPIPINTLNNKLRIPGGFSPNNDGVNDYFVIENASQYNITVKMYNRWQNLVYDSKGYYNNDWDGICREPGTLFNNRLPDGTYFYIIEIFDKTTNELYQRPIGFITLKR
jgi:gliding motility-associated-like protein